MADSKPLLTIGVPVYNGEKYLRQALDSLLAQSYENFELMISDNASTDQTGDICRSYAAKDERVRYYRNPLTVPINDNFHRVLTLASSDYFMWAACDDCWSFNYVEALIQRLLECAHGTLAAGRTLYIDDDGALRPTEPDDAPARYPNSRVDIAKQLLRQHAAGWLHGLGRRPVLLRFMPTLLAGNPWGSDMVFLLKLCIETEVVGSDAAVMYKRVAGTNSAAPQTARDIVRWERWYAWALMQVILNSSLSVKEMDNG